MYVHICICIYVCVCVEAPFKSSTCCGSLFKKAGNEPRGPQDSPRPPPALGHAHRGPRSVGGEPVVVPVGVLRSMPGLQPGPFQRTKQKWR